MTFTTHKALKIKIRLDVSVSPKPLLVSGFSEVGHLHGWPTGRQGSWENGTPSTGHGRPTPCTRPRLDVTERGGSRDVASSPPRDSTAVWPVLLPETKPFGPGGPQCHLGSPGSGCCARALVCLAVSSHDLRSGPWWVPVRATTAHSPHPLQRGCPRRPREALRDAGGGGPAPSTEGVPRASGTEDPAKLNELE